MAIILSQITVGDHRIMVVDSAPNTGAGITAPIGSMIIVEGQDAVWLKTGNNDTDWKVSTVDKVALDAQLVGIEGDIAQEILDRGAADTTLQGNIDAEESRALAAEGLLDGRLDTLELDPVTKTYVDGEVTNLQNQIDLLSTGTQAELDATQLGAGLNVDGSYTAPVGSNYLGSATSLKNADTKLDTQIKVVADGLAQEILDRVADVNAEESRALLAEGVLQDNIDAEALARLNADNALDARLDVIEGIGVGSIAKAEQDAKDYADAAVLVETNARVAEDLTFVKLDGTRAMTGSLNMGGHKVEFLHAPENASDAATKEYVDDLLAGLSWKEAVHTATVASENVNLSNPGTATIGGHLLVQGQRVLIKDQTDAKENGIYIFDSSSTALVRSSDANTWSELEGAVVYVEQGTNAGGKFVATIPPGGTIGVDNITFTMFSAASAIDGVGTADTVAVWTDVHTLGSSLVTTQELEYVSGVTSGIQGQIDAEETARINADNALDARLDIIEGPNTQVGSIAKAEKDAKDYADAAVLVETNARISADNALDLRLDALELDPVTKTYVDAADSALDLRLDTLELDPVTKTYVDAADSALDLRLDALELDSVTKTYVDNQDALKLNLSGGTMSGNIDMGGNDITNVDQVSGSLVVIQSIGDVQLNSTLGDIKLLADTVGSKVIVNRVITGLENGVGSTDAVNKSQLDAVDSAKLNLSGGTMSGNINMGTHSITNVVDPVSLQDAATKNYVDTQDQSVLTTAATYTDNAIASLVDSAPALLDTLNELAAALGDDPNFVTTITTQLGNIQSELDTTQTGAGLGTSGSYTANGSANYISSAVSLKDADNKLDAALKAEEVARIAADALKVNKAGDTMSGDLNMGSNDIVSVASIGINTATPETILHLEESTVKFTTRMVSSQTVGSVNSVIASVAPASNTVELLKIKVIGIDIASHDSVAYERTVRVKNIGGVVSLGTVQADYTSEDPSLASANCTFVQNGSNIDVRVTGVNAKTITWKCVVERVR